MGGPTDQDALHEEEHIGDLLELFEGVQAEEIPDFVPVKFNEKALGVQCKTVQESISICIFEAKRKDAWSWAGCIWDCCLPLFSTLFCTLSG